MTDSAFGAGEDRGPFTRGALLLQLAVDSRVPFKQLVVRKSEWEA